MSSFLFLFRREKKQEKKQKKKKSEMERGFSFSLFYMAKTRLDSICKVKPTDIYLYPPAAPLMKLFLAEKQGTLSKP